MTPIEEIAAERKRQIEKEGYDARHDDRHEKGEIALAACCYASPTPLYLKDERASAFIMRDPWPWDDSFDKRPVYQGRSRQPGLLSAKLRDLLVKAAALLVAEIERLDRSAKREAA
jgi:hypothetical protein